METFTEAPIVGAAEPQKDVVFQSMDDLNLDKYDNILELDEGEYPQFTLAKNKARFLRAIPSPLKRGAKFP